MGMGFAPTWLRQVSPGPDSHDHFNHWVCGGAKIFGSVLLQPARSVCVFLSAFFHYKYC